MPHALIEIALDDGAVDAAVATPPTPGRHPPILLLGGRRGLDSRLLSWAARLSAHSFFVLAPDLSDLSADDRREAGWAALDHLADERACDDERVGVVGFGAGADLALVLAGWRAERIAAVAAYGGRGFGPRSAVEIAQRINGFVRIGYQLGGHAGRAGVVETALAAAGVLFDIEVYGEEPDGPGLIDLMHRVLRPAAAASRAFEADNPATPAPPWRISGGAPPLPR
ncbi:MAG: dienelactone hydrolase family protein [Phenylobacterium sp.]|uniref:dienelactone hydrolase family protein n=1 Tax=Phenylobacterium sp. TaxID=1871053 RepID=UPI001A503D3F|nr:dienelactone hydrolase family protein [Phenylobacterium sp.]MBL8770352.1 dienelactone hydrolase family protein [Phenylobacterium sp.]